MSKIFDGNRIEGWGEENTVREKERRRGEWADSAKPGLKRGGEMNLIHYLKNPRPRVGRREEMMETIYERVEHDRWQEHVPRMNEISGQE